MFPRATDLGLHRVAPEGSEDTYLIRSGFYWTTDYHIVLSKEYCPLSMCIHRCKMCSRVPLKRGVVSTSTILRSRLVNV